MGEILRELSRPERQVNIGVLVVSEYQLLHHVAFLEVIDLAEHGTVLSGIQCCNRQRWHSGGGFIKDVLLAMTFSPGNTNQVPKKSVRTMMHEHILEFGKRLLAIDTNIVAKANIVSEVAETSG